MDKKTQRKKEIIQDSIDLMYLTGYNATSVQDITNAAGIPKGSFYNYFEGKEEYAVEAVRYYSELLDDMFVSLREEHLDPLDRIKEFYKSKIQGLCDKRLEYGCFVGNLSEEVGGVCPAIEKETAKFHDKVEDMVYENLKEAVRKKNLKNNLDERVLAGFIVNSWQGALLRVKVVKDKKILVDFITVLSDCLLK